MASYGRTLHLFGRCAAVSAHWNSRVVVAATAAAAVGGRAAPASVQLLASSTSRRSPQRRPLLTHAKHEASHNSIATTASPSPEPCTSDRKEREQLGKAGEMVVLVVATTTDPASYGPASAFLDMPGWQPVPSSIPGMETFSNKSVRLLRHGRGIVEEDDLDRRWQEATGEEVEEVVYLSKHISAVNRPALTVHPIGVPHLAENEIPLQGGKPGWAGPPSPRIGPWLRLLKKIATNLNLVPEFDITLEATHHGPVVNTSTMFVEIGSTEEYWRRPDAAQAVATLLWEGLGLDGNGGVGTWTRENSGNKVLLGIGGGHYAPRHMDVVQKDGVWVGHLLSGYSLPMEDPKGKTANGGNDIGGRWKDAILASVEATKSSFPGGEVIAHLDHKSFKSWQKNAITNFLTEQNIKVGKPADFL